MKTIASTHLTLIAATLEHLRTELDRPDELARLLDAAVSPHWPPGEYDRDAMEFFKARLEEGGPGAEGWYGWYAAREADREAPRALVGSGGYLGPPDEHGTVEIGYSVLPEWRKRGYASEIVGALVENAFSFPPVRKVVAHAAEANRTSVAVLLRNGFLSDGSGRESGLLCFSRTRS